MAAKGVIHPQLGGEHSRKKQVGHANALLLEHSDLEAALQTPRAAEWNQESLTQNDYILGLEFLAFGVVP